MHQPAPKPRPTLKSLGIIPDAGMVLMCDFQGYVSPEMVKNRQVVVISPKLINQLGTLLVVPISKNEPKPLRRFHVHFPTDCYPCFTAKQQHWAKCNLVAHVRFDRCDRVIANGVWCTPSISADHLDKIRIAVGHAIGA